LAALPEFTIFTKNYLTMKKLFLILALFCFTGSMAVSSYAATNDVSIELEDDDKKKKRKKKKKKKCCAKKSKKCASSSAKKSCCSKAKG